MILAPIFAAAMLAPAPPNEGIWRVRDVPEWNAPKQYDRPYRGNLTLHMVPQRRVPQMCIDLFRENGVPNPPYGITPRQRGCAYSTGPNTCTVIMADREVRGTQPGAILRHEIGHCNGWGPRHSGESNTAPNPQMEAYIRGIIERLQSR